MVPMYPFVAGASQQLSIPTDRRAFYDIMRRLKSMFKLDIELSELKALGDAESRELQSALERIGESSPEAKQIIDQVRAEYNYTPFEEPVELDPALDQTLNDILRNTREPE
jgi:hypothetical protein